ncbi:MAG TPA: hydroxysqualene dehydroxylase HpnE [Gaiellaceae bacterium]|nr:hydroxysqualene dehydroxylase HpnE [Gaiellaceae bacterium]
MRAVVVGGGLAGCTAALELVDAGHEVTLVEARPTLGGAVQTLPEREGDPSPPPDNGQHIALGCFTEYIRFLERVGEAGSVDRLRLDLPVVDENRHWSRISALSILLGRYGHLPRRERPGARVLLSLRGLEPAAHDDETFGKVLLRMGQTERAIDRFWDVFIRPALNLPTRAVSAGAALFTVQTGLLSGRKASEVLLPARPLGWMHGDAAGRALEAAGASVHTGSRVESLDDLDADAVVLAVPPNECARLLDEPPPRLEDSPIVSVHLQFDRKLLEPPLAALLGSDAHWVFDRGALTRHPPAEGQYLTVVSSGVPELMELRGRALVDLIAGQLTERLGPAELVWSRVSREPHATIALRPGTARVRPGAETSRPNVVRAGAWTDTGWPATMESAVRSGRAAARALAARTSQVAA